MPQCDACQCDGFLICSRMFSQIWDLDNLLPLQLLNRHEGGVNSLVLYNDMLLSASDDHEIKVNPWISFTSWWRHQMETFSALLAICAGNSPGTGEFLAQSPVTRSFDVFIDLCLNKRLSKQWWGWWFETPSRPLWRHPNIDKEYYMTILPLTGTLCGEVASQKISSHKGPIRRHSDDLL